MPTKPARAGRPRRPAVASTPPSATPRVRRDRAEDAERLRAALLQAASELFAQGGLAAVTMRAVAARVGISAMTPYRYFADKSELLGGLWQFVIQALYDRMSAALSGVSGAQGRLRASIDAYLGYWEDHPDHYRLVYMTERTTARQDKSNFTAAPIYGQVLAFAAALTQDLATELGADAARVPLATDLRISMAVGYLHAALVMRRYPWSDLGALRACYVDEIYAATERCLRGPPARPQVHRAGP